MTKTDERVTKRRVTMQSSFLTGAVDDQGRPEIATASATDYVLPEVLDAYVSDAKTRWQLVQVSDEADAGPGGYGGATFIGPQLNHPMANTYFPAFDCGPDCTHAPEGAHVVFVPDTTPEG